MKKEPAPSRKVGMRRETLFFLLCCKKRFDGCKDHNRQRKQADAPGDAGKKRVQVQQYKQPAHAAQNEGNALNKEQVAFAHFTAPFQRG